MKLITLNTWGGRAGKEGLLSFFENNKDDVDIFCLQEMWSAAYENLERHPVDGSEIDYKHIMFRGVQEIGNLLSNHAGYFRPHLMDNYGLTMYMRKTLDVVDEGEIFVYKHKGYIPEGDAGNHARNIQYATFVKGERPVTIINFHGLWNGKGKTDTEDRIRQSKNILDFTNRLKGDFVLCGDFNLMPDTESIKLFETAGLRNLIKEYKITSTRTLFYTKPEKHADYIFVSKGIKVLTFKVLPDEVSDHAPLLLEFE